MANNRLTHIQQLVASRRAKQVNRHVPTTNQAIFEFLKNNNTEFERFMKDLREKRKLIKEQMLNDISEPT